MHEVADGAISVLLFEVGLALIDVLLAIGYRVRTNRASLCALAVTALALSMRAHRRW